MTDLKSRTVMCDFYLFGCLVVVLTQKSIFFVLEKSSHLFPCSRGLSGWSSEEISKETKVRFFFTASTLTFNSSPESHCFSVCGKKKKEAFSWTTGTEVVPLALPFSPSPSLSVSPSGQEKKPSPGARCALKAGSGAASQTSHYSTKQCLKTLDHSLL